MAASVRLNEDYQDLQDCCLIQDTLFYLEGKGCLYAFAGKHVEDRNHNVILCIDSLRNHLLLDVGLSSSSQKMKDRFSKNNNGIVLRKNDDNFRSSDDPLCMIHVLLCKTSDIVPYILVQSAAHDAMEGYAGSAVGVVNATKSAGCLSNFILPVAILTRKPFFPEISHETPQLIIIPVATWEGEIYGLERASKHVLWSFSSGLSATSHEVMCDVVVGKEEEMNPSKFDVKEDQFLFIDENLELAIFEKQQPFPNSIDGYKQKIPYSRGHMVFVGHSTTKTYLVDIKTGRIIKVLELELPVFDLKDCHINISYSVSELIYITRADFSIFAYDARTARARWVVKLAEFKAFYPFERRRLSQHPPAELHYYEFAVPFALNESLYSLQMVLENHSGNGRRKGLYLPPPVVCREETCLPWYSPSGQKIMVFSLGLLGGFFCYKWSMSGAKYKKRGSIKNKMLNTLVKAGLNREKKDDKEKNGQATERGALKTGVIKYQKKDRLIDLGDGYEGKGSNFWLFRGSYDNKDAVIKSIKMDGTENDSTSFVKQHENIAYYLGCEEKGGKLYVAFEPQCDLINVIYGSFVEIQHMKFCVSDKLNVPSSTAELFLGTYQERTAVIKRFPNSKLGFAKNEHRILAKLHHDNVISVFGTLAFDHFFHYIVLERCECNLKELIDGSCDLGINLWNGRYPSDQLLDILRDVVEGLSYLHSQRIIHMDLKPENILIAKLANGKIRGKIADMGCSRQLTNESNSLSDSGSGQVLGTPTWRAREMYDSCSRSTHLDMFSLGCLLFFCVTKGKHPFGSQEDTENESTCNIEARIKGCMNPPQLKLIKNYFPEAHDIIEQLLNHIPDRRPEVGKVLRHHFLWNSEQRCSFFTKMHETLKEHEEDGAHLRSLKYGLLRDLEIRESAAGATLWFTKKKVDSCILDSTAPNQKTSYDNSLKDLIKAIRHKVAHRDGLSKDQKALLGEYPAGFDIYFRERFPKLLQNVYEAIDKYPSLK